MSYKIPDNIINKDLYLKAIKKANETYERPSAYKSAYIQKEYKRLGGEYTHKTKGLNNWFKEQWIQVVPYLENNEKIECGSDDNENKACRPLRRVNKNSPESISELLKKFGKNKLLKLAKEKTKNMDKRLNWEEGKFYDGGFIDFNKFNLNELKNYVKVNKLFKGYSKMRKQDLINKIEFLKLI